MEKVVLLILSISITYLSFAQNRVYYNYDSAGNRVTRSTSSNIIANNCSTVDMLKMVRNKIPQDYPKSLETKIDLATDKRRQNSKLYAIAGKKMKIKHKRV